MPYDFAVPRRSTNSASRRRATPLQGRALEMLGHAIEYLADSELHNGECLYSRDVAQAAGILAEQSRRVFAGCEEIVPLSARVRECLIRMFGRPELMLPPSSSGAGLRH
ncbi:MAG: hypothetical protein M3O02_10945 [Acidobacteriota bacterium]|nr:hypothetical protein [Acidobacteriota bacterium]